MSMAVGLARSFELLKSTLNHAAGDLFAELVLHGGGEWRELAMIEILEKHPRDGLAKLVAHFDQLPPRQQQQLLRLGPALTHAVRDAYLSEDPIVHQNGCELIRRLPAYDQLPLLLGSLEKQSARREEAETLIAYLAEQLADDLEREPHDRHQADAEGNRRHCLAALSVAFKRFPTHKSEVVPQAILMLAPEDSELVRSTIAHPLHPCHAAMMEALRQKREPSIARWIFHLLDSPNAPASVLQLLSHRRDQWFIEQLLDRVDLVAHTHVLRALRQVKELPWLSSASIFQNLSPSRQSAFVIWGVSTGVALDVKIRVIARALDEGATAARITAACALAQCPGTDAGNLALACLDDDVPEIQLAAIHQIRGRRPSNALQLLVQKLDHPDPRVAEAARQGLSEYSFEKYARSFEQLEEETRKVVGDLVLRIDRDADEKLIEMLSAPHRNSRLRALKIAQALDRAKDLWPDLLACMGDEDHVVRRTALETILDVDEPGMADRLATLAHTGNTAAFEAIRTLTTSSTSPSVREAASSTLKTLLEVKSVAID